MVKKKTKERISIESLVNSHCGVTGISWLLKYPKPNNEFGKILVECGK